VKEDPSDFALNFTSPPSLQGFLAPLSVTKKQLSSAPPCAGAAAPAGSETVQRSFLARLFQQ